MGRVKDFLPYASKIHASGAQAVLTGNWGNDLTLLVKAAREVGLRRQASTPSTATRSVRRRPSARPASAACSPWPNGCPNVRTARVRGVLRRFRAALPQAARRLRARAHAADGRDAGRRRSRRPAAPTRWPSRGARERVDGRRSAAPERHDARRRPPVPAAAGRQRDGPRRARRACKFDVEGSGYGFRACAISSRRGRAAHHAARWRRRLTEERPRCASHRTTARLEDPRGRQRRHGPRRRAGVLVRRKRRGDARVRSARPRSSRCARRDLLRAQPRPARAARGGRGLHERAASGGRRRPHRDHLVGRQRADARDAGAGRTPATRWWPSRRCGPT